MHCKRIGGKDNPNYAVGLEPYGTDEGVIHFAAQ